MTARAKPGTTRRVLDDAMSEASALAIWVEVDGAPVQQGSKYAPKAGVVGEARGADLKAWRELVGTKALQARNAARHFAPVPLHQAVHVSVAFRLRCPPNRVPGSHAPVTPDIDKLLRAILDALTGVAYCDDRQVVEVTASKRFTYPDEEQPGVSIAVQAIADPAVGRTGVR